MMILASVGIYEYLHKVHARLFIPAYHVDSHSVIVSNQVTLQALRCMLCSELLKQFPIYERLVPLSKGKEKYCEMLFTCLFYEYNTEPNKIFSSLHHHHLRTYQRQVVLL